jgi:hypothetical protein
MVSIIQILQAPDWYITKEPGVVRGVNSLADASLAEAGGAK